MANRRTTPIQRGVWPAGLVLLLLWGGWSSVWAQSAPSLADRALLQAAAAGQAERVAYALERGADIETRGPRNHTALLLAVRSAWRPWSCC